MKYTFIFIFQWSQHIISDEASNVKVVESLSISAEYQKGEMMLFLVCIIVQLIMRQLSHI